MKPKQRGQQRKTNDDGAAASLAAATGAPRGPDNLQDGEIASVAILAQAEFDRSSIEAAEADESKVPTFKMTAYNGGEMNVRFWPHPVVIDLAGMRIPEQQLPIRFNHDSWTGIGHTTMVEVTGGSKLQAEGMISRDTEHAREVVASAKRGFPWRASVGASAEEFDFIQEKQKVTVNGKKFTGPIYVVRKSELGEISFVDAGADRKSSVKIAAQQQQAKETVMDPDEQGTNDTKTPAGIAAAAGAATGATTNATPAPAAGAAPVEAAAAPATKQGVDGVPDHVQAMRDQAAAELTRIAAIRKICGGKHDEIQAKAIQEGWDQTKCELEVLRASRPTVGDGAPTVIAGGSVAGQPVTADVLAAACMMSGKLENIEKLCDEKALNAADKRFGRSLGMQELLLEAAWANGYTGRNARDMRSVLAHAFGRSRVEASFSTIDMGGILSNVANKFLLAGFMAVERTWRNITAIRNVTDFKTVTSYRLVGSEQYEQVAPGGEIKHGTLEEESFTNRADTYGLMLSVDRRDIINDDLGAITTVPRKLGRGSGLKINDVFWTAFLANSSFFTSARNNYFEGAGTVLGIDALTQADVLFMNQVDPQGKPIGTVPMILLVPPALSAMANRLNKSTELREPSSSDKVPVANPHEGKFRAEVSRYLSNASYAGYSSTAWYLLASPEDLPVIETAFLNGQESPTIETAEANFNVLGIQMRGYHDFGVSLHDHRGGVKSKGAA